MNPPSKRRHSINSLWNLIKNYRFRSMFFSYFSSIALVMAVIFMIYALFSYCIYSRNQEERMTFFSEKTLNQTSNILNIILSKVEQQFYIIENDIDIVEFLNMDYSYQEPFSVNHTKSNVINRLFTLTVDNNQTESIYVYSYKNGDVSSWNDCKPLNSFFDKKFISSILNQESAFSQRPCYPNGSGPQIVTIAKQIVSPFEEVTGLAMINLNYEELSQTLSAGNDSHTINTIIAPNGTIIFSDREEYVNQPISKIDHLSSLYPLATQEAQTIFTTSGSLTSFQTVLGNYMVISESDWKNAGTAKGNFILFFAGCFAGLLASVCLAFFVSLRMYGYVIDLITVFKVPLDNTLTENTAESELHFVGQQIISTLEQNQIIESELADKMIELKKAQAIALQAQINPHFLLNSLQLINLDLMKQAKGDTTATLAIAILSDILRNNLNTTEYIVTLAYEIEQAKKYTDMENLRSKQKYTIIWNVPQALLEFQTIKFILQPLLENCIIHGLTNSAKPRKEITITVTKDSNILQYEIADNGEGMAADQLSDLRKRLDESHIPKNKHVGICNVDMRIKLLCGNTFGVSIHSTPQIGTSVILRHPILKKS